MLPLLISVSITEEEGTLDTNAFSGGGGKCVNTVADPEGETVQRGTRAVKRIR